MVGGMIGLVFCLMCAVPFLIISVYNKDSKESISFWSGDTTLKSKVKNLTEYNYKMAALYKRYAIALFNFRNRMASFACSLRYYDLFRLYAGYLCIETIKNTKFMYIGNWDRVEIGS